VSARFDAILFDAGGIFVVPDPGALGMIVHRFGGGRAPEHLVRAHYAGMAALDDHALATSAHSIDAFSWDTYRAAFARCAGVPEDRIDDAVTHLRRLYSPFLWRFPLLESVSALWRLHLRGTPVGVVSNASGQIEATLANQCVAQVGPGAGVPVLIVTDSHVVGFAKPDPRIFTDAIAMLAANGISPERTAYVGDSFVNDVGAARNAGMTGILLDPHGDHAHRECERIASLHELIEFVA